MNTEDTDNNKNNKLDSITYKANQKHMRIDHLKMLSRHPIDRYNTKVTLLYGKPNTEKSSFATDAFPNAYRKDNTQWWNHYLGETTVIWDEFGRWSCAPSEYLKVFSKLPHNVEVKTDNGNGTITLALRANKFIIISELLPDQWWDISNGDIDITKITSTIDTVIWFHTPNKVPYIFSDYGDFYRAVQIPVKSLKNYPHFINVYIFIHTTRIPSCTLFAEANNASLHKL